VIAVEWAVHALDQRRLFTGLATRAAPHPEADYLEFHAPILVSLHDVTIAVELTSRGGCAASR